MSFSARNACRVSTVAVVSMLMAVTVSAPANGGHGAAANSGVPDNALHCVDRNSVTAKVDGAVQHAIGQLDRSDMDASLSCSGDVEVYDEYYGTAGDWNNTYGRTNCEAYTGGIDNIRCDVYRVRYNLTYFAGYAVSTANSGGCHEFGHTAGLGHRDAGTDSDNNSCMRATVSGTRQSFDNHDLDSINDHV